MRHRRGAANGVDACVLELVEAQAVRAPGALAVDDGSAQLTYGALDRRADAIAMRLRARGLGVERHVGVCVPRSAALPAALLGVLKAGAAYTPLDPAYPIERLRSIVATAQLDVVIVDRAHRGLFDREPVHELVVDDVVAPAETIRVTRAACPLRPGNLAYVVYTSGSTGEPKGVAVEHRGLSNLVAWHQRAYAVRAVDRATLVAAVGFDASVWELWPYLASGASVMIPPDPIRADPEHLLHWLAAERITLCFVPTPLAEIMAGLLDAGAPAPPSLRALLTGGDRLHRRARRPLGFRFVNHYGPTEDTVVTTAVDVEPGDGAPSIGHAIARHEVFVVDDGLERVAPGAPGELAIGGIGLARGYIGRPDLTAERFVPHPWADRPGARLYLTGDVVRAGADGAIEFVGRRDAQVKVRGARVELGDVEAALERHPHVRHAAVVARDDGPVTRLYGYVVPTAPEAVTDEELRRFAATLLPGPMVPSRCALVAALPLTPNGKIDRAALAARGDADGDVALLGPRTAVEHRLAEIWRDVLAMGPIDVRSNFFEVGGDSLLAAQVAARVRSAFGIALSVRQIFERPSIHELASTLDDARAQDGAGVVDAAR